MTSGGSDEARRVILRTARTVVTTWIGGDAADLAELHADAETMRFVRHGRPETRAEVEDLVGEYAAVQTERSFAKWRLADLEGRLIGRAGFGGTDECRSIGYVIARPLWGQGLATEVAEGLVAWHLRHAPHAELQALVVIGNDASVRVLERTGFVRTGTDEADGIVCWTYAYPVGGESSTP